MIIYEIVANVAPNLAFKFREYMEGRHIPDLMKTGFFEEAEMTEIETCRFVIRYTCETREVLDEYQEKHADELRRDFVENFPEGVTLERKIYQVETE